MVDWFLYYLIIQHTFKTTCIVKPAAMFMPRCFCRCRFD